MGFLSSLFGQGTSKEEIKSMIAAGAVIIDVRSSQEFQGGHVAGSKNIPLQTIGNKAQEIKKLGKPLVLCCASGMRSGQAEKMLQSKGINCKNAGGWKTVNSLIE